MAPLDESKLRTDIAAILKDADLCELSSKKVRRMLEGKYDLDLTERKQQIDTILMALISESNSQNEDNGQNEAESPPQNQETENHESAEESIADNKQESSSDELIESSDDNINENSNKKRAKKQHHEAGPSGDTDSEFEAPEDVATPRRKRAKKEMDDAAIARKLQDEEDEGGPRTRGRRASSGKKRHSGGEKSKRKGTKGPGRGNSIYSKQLQLSSQLSKIVGANKMARSDVVKKMWEIIKRRDLLDPKNRQYMICDSELKQLFGRKRIRCFGMLKFLKDHMWKDD